MTDKSKTEIPESWEYEPAFLSKAQRADPIWWIYFFAKWESLFEMRNRLRDAFIAAMYSPHWADDNEETKGDAMKLYEDLTVDRTCLLREPDGI